MAPACQKTPKMAEGCSKDPNGPGLLENTKMVQAVWRILKWSRLVEGSKNGPGLSEDPKKDQACCRIQKWTRLVGGSKNGPGGSEDPKKDQAC